MLMGGLVVACVLLIQSVLLADYYLHSPFYSGLVCDSKVYYKWAEKIFSGDWIGQEVFHQAPLYPYFIASLWMVFGKHYLTIYISQALMLALIALFTFLMAKKCFDDSAALAAGLLCAFYGALNLYALKILPDVFGVFLLLWLAYLILNATLPWQWFRAGWVCGLLIIARPNALLLLPLMFLWIMTSDLRRSPRDGSETTSKSLYIKLKQFTFFLLPVIMLVGLTALRNHLMEPGLVLVSSSGGETFCGGNNPKADGIYCRLEGVSPDIEHEKADAKSVAEADLERRLTSAEVSHYWFKRGLSFIRQDFKKYVRLEATKLKRIFSGTEYANMYFLWFERTEFTRSLAIPAVHFYIILPLAIIGAILCAGNWRKYGLLYIMIIFNLLTMLLFFVDERYRLPMIPFLIILGAGGIRRAIKIIRDGTGSLISNLGILALLAAALAATIHIHATEPERLAVKPQLYNNLAEVYYEKHDYQKALSTFYKSSRLTANNWEAALGIGKTLFALGKKDMAVNLYRQSFPNLDKDIQTSCLRDHDLDALREYMNQGKTNAVPPRSRDSSLP